MKFPATNFGIPETSLTLPSPPFSAKRSEKREGGRGLKQCSSGLEARGGLTRTTQAWKVGGNTDKSINEAFGLF